MADEKARQKMRPGTGVRPGAKASKVQRGPRSRPLRGKNAAAQHVYDSMAFVSEAIDGDKTGHGGVPPQHRQKAAAFVSALVMGHVRCTKQPRGHWQVVQHGINWRP